MKILSIVGARPQFIKEAMVSRVFASTAAQFKVATVLVHTGQHYSDNMSANFFSELDIHKPNYNLNIGSATHAQQIGKMLIASEKVLQKEQPDFVVVYGDTNSTLAGALAAVQLNIPVVHIEAGLRSFNRKMPEENNRIITDHLSSILFAPTEISVENLSHEGVPKEKIHLVGDVMYDAFLYYRDIAEKKSQILEKLKIKPDQYILATIHRAENTDDLSRLQNIFKTLIKLSRKYSIVMPLHPKTQKIKKQLKIDSYPSSMKFIEPVGYLDMMILEKNSCFIVTDSGGVQKEAFFYHKPCIIMRDETEWIELQRQGWAKVLSPAENHINLYEKIKKFLEDFHPQYILPYGNGNASNLIVNILLKT